MEKEFQYQIKKGFSNVRKEGMNYYLAFLVWPFGITLAALRHWERPWSKNVFWIFCVFFGYTFIIAKDTYSSADSVRYAQILVEYAHSGMSLGELLRSFYSESSNYVDIAQPLITYLVSRVTDNPSILFALYGLIFGYFYSRNIWFVLSKIDGNITFITLLFILTFALINPIWNINGFRMWTAAQIFLFGALPYLLEGNSKRLIWSGVAIFVHFSFIFPIVILLFFIFFKNRINIYMALFILTTFIKELDLQLVQTALSYLPDIFRSRTLTYTNLDYVELDKITNQSYNWYVLYSNKGIGWVSFGIALFSYFFCRKFLMQRQNLMTLFCFSLLLFSFSNMLSFIPSGDRFLTVANTFMFVFFVVLFSVSANIKSLVFIKAFSIPLLLLFCIVSIRSGMDYYGLMTIFGNPLFASLNIDVVPLITGIKGLF